MNDTIQVWSSALGLKPEFSLKGHTATCVTLAVMPDGERLVSGSADSTIQVWDTARSYKPIAVLTGHTGVVMQVLPLDADRLVSFSALDQTVRLWDLHTCTCVLTIPCAEARAMALIRT